MSLRIIKQEVEKRTVKSLLRFVDQFESDSKPGEIVGMTLRRRERKLQER